MKWFLFGIVCGLCVATSVQAAPKRTDTPLVLVPGFMGQKPTGIATSYFMGWRESLEAAGADVHEIAPPPVASSHERGLHVLRAIDDVLKVTGAKRVVVITHSQGGLDLRHALVEGASDRIAAVATIAAPHHGTGVADTALRWPRFAVVAALASSGALWQAMQGDTITDGDATAALESLSTKGATEFTAANPIADVPLFSVAGFTGDDVDGTCANDGKWTRPAKRDSMHASLAFGTAMIRNALGDVSHDGVVPTGSMKFGTFLGCVAADHVDWEGWDTRSDLRAFVVELWRGLDDVAREEDPGAMDRRVARLALLANARPR